MATTPTVRQARPAPRSSRARFHLDLRMPKPGTLRLQVATRPRPRIFVRCEHAAGQACSTQSRRFQSLVDIGTELAFRPELAVPPITVNAVLPHDWDQASLSDLLNTQQMGCGTATTGHRLLRSGKLAINSSPT